MSRNTIPRVVFGTTSLGNIFTATTHEEKLAVVKKIFEVNPKPLFDSAGKYGAGMALEELEKCLSELNIDPSDVIISNKLAWRRIPLTTPEPTFESCWVDLEHDAVQDISYEGILRCFEEGNTFLGKYSSQMVSVHDPDEYLAAAEDDADLKRRQQDILGAYRALEELRDSGKVQSVGVGAKDISSIEWIADHIKLDWAMYACSITPYSHSPLAKSLLKKLEKQGVHVINSAVFHGGFLIGTDMFNYRKVSRDSEPELYAWRDKFQAICKEFDISPAAACVQFSFLFPAIKSIALNTTRPSRVVSNMELVNTVIPEAFWERLKAECLIDLE